MKRIGLLLALSLVATACNATVAEMPTSEALPTTTGMPTTTTTEATIAVPASTTSTTLAPVEPREHWIRIDGTGFVDTRTGDPFVPRGVNLLRRFSDGSGDQLFALYDPEWVEKQLDGISELGLNTVRFFLDLCRPCTSDADGRLTAGQSVAARPSELA